jgi:sarcosine oxidase
VIRIAPSGAALHDAMRASAAAFGLPYETLSPADVHDRFPAFAVPDGYEALFEEGAGVVYASAAVAAMQRRATGNGAALRFDEPALDWSADDDGVRVSTAQDTYHAGQLVITAGSWTGRLVAALGLPLVPTRVVNATFRPLDLGPHVNGAMPAFIISDGHDGVYGTPAVTGEGVKVGASGTPTDPDHVDRTVRPEEVDVLRGWLDGFVPGASGPLVSTLTCLYTVAPDGDFVIDRHPAHDNVTVASPCSGHGFKYTPAIGALLADMATDVAPRFDLSSFAIDRFATVP